MSQKDFANFLFEICLIGFFVAIWLPSHQEQMVLSCIWGIIMSLLIYHDADFKEKKDKEKDEE